MKRFVFGLSLVIVVFGLVYRATRPHQPQKLSAEAPMETGEPSPGAEVDPQSSQSASARTQAVTAQDHPIPTASAPSPEAWNEAEFLRAFRETDFARSMPTARLVERIEASWSAETALYLTRYLDAIGDSDPNERGRLIFLANELRSPDLTEFWTKVLDRNPPAFPNEAELLSAAEPNLSTMSLRNELNAAMRNLGVSAFRQEAARTALQSYVRTRDPRIDNTMARKDAYYRLKEAHPTQAARSLSSLAEDDPLRNMLSYD